jgi:excisionase family DNA binding protein
MERQFDLPYMSVMGVAKHLGISPATVIMLIKKGDLPETVSIGTRKMFERTALEKWGKDQLKKRRVPQTTIRPRAIATMVVRSNKVTVQIDQKPLCGLSGHRSVRHLASFITPNDSTSLGQHLLSRIGSQ